MEATECPTTVAEHLAAGEELLIAAGSSSAAIS
jgi:hypothetical protein